MSTILIDIDDTVALLVQEWLKLYNTDWDDNLTEDQITDWHIGSFTKPECQEKMYVYLDLPTLYDNVQPVPGALEGVTALRDTGNKIIWATHSTPNSMGRKFEWLRKNGFLDKSDHYFESLTKGKHLITADIQIDDSYDNIKQFPGYAIMLSRPWNLKYTHFPTVNNWFEILDIVERIKQI